MSDCQKAFRYDFSDADAYIFAGGAHANACYRMELDSTSVKSWMGNIIGMGMQFEAVNASSWQFALADLI